jgi:glucose/arabinose dehydrogenase
MDGAAPVGGRDLLGGAAAFDGRPDSGGGSGSDGRLTGIDADAGLPDGASPDRGSPVDAPMDVPVDAAGSLDGPLALNTCVGPPSAAVANASLPAGYCAWIWASELGRPRGIVRNSKGDMLVLDSRSGRILLLHDDDGNGVSDAKEQVVLATASGLNHGIALAGGFLYASTETTVFRWAYSNGRQALGTPQTVVSGIPSGGHFTRTLLFDGQGNLYVSLGSAGNVDADTSRARVIRYPASALSAASTYAQGEVFATGLRNEVGLALDGQGRIWGVENGRDDLLRSDLGGDIHNDNPGEELNLFAQPGRFYGFPYCWSEFSLPAGLGAGPGTQWADPGFMTDGTHTDAWCRNAANVVRPVLVMQAHSAPLDIKFYQGSAFPRNMAGSALVTYHGSWDRTPATGYKVVSIPFGTDGMPSSAPVSLLEYSGAGDAGGGWPHRPVGLEIGLDGRVFVTSDDSGVVIAIGYSSGP